MLSPWTRHYFTVLRNEMFAEMAAARREGDCLDCEQQPPKVVPQQLPRRLVNVGHDGPDTGERAVVVVREFERVEETGAERRRKFGGGDVLLEISVHSPFLPYAYYYVLEEESLDMQTKKQAFVYSINY